MTRANAAATANSVSVERAAHQMAHQKQRGDPNRWPRLTAISYSTNALSALKLIGTEGFEPATP